MPQLSPVNPEEQMDDWEREFRQSLDRAGSGRRVHPVLGAYV